MDRGVWVSFECATNGTEQNRKESAFKSCFLSFFSSKRRSDIESVHVKQVVKKKSCPGEKAGQSSSVWLTFVSILKLISLLSYSLLFFFCHSAPLFRSNEKKLVQIDSNCILSLNGGGNQTKIWKAQKVVEPLLFGILVVGVLRNEVRRVVYRVHILLVEVVVIIWFLMKSPPPPYAGSSFFFFPEIILIQASCVLITNAARRWAGLGPFSVFSHHVSSPLYTRSDSMMTRIEEDELYRSMGNLLGVGS